MKSFALIILELSNNSTIWSQIQRNRENNSMQSVKRQASSVLPFSLAVCFFSIKSRIALDIFLMPKRKFTIYTVYHAVELSCVLPFVFFPLIFHWFFNFHRYTENYYVFASRTLIVLLYSWNAMILAHRKR